MRSLVSLVSIVALLVAQVPALAAPAVQASSDWTAVMRLKPGTPLIVEDASGQNGLVTFIRADNTMLIVLDVTDPAIPSQAKKLLQRAAAEQPTYLADDVQHVVLSNEVRLESNQLGPRRSEMPYEALAEVKPDEMPVQLGRHLVFALVTAAAFAVSVTGQQSRQTACKAPTNATACY